MFPQTTSGDLNNDNGKRKMQFGMRPRKAIGHKGDSGSAARFFYCAKASKADRGDTNNHPTVKPTDLMRYLCRLVTPPNGIVLDPFTGSGSTGKAAILEGFQFIGIEREAEYVEIARARIEHAIKTKPNTLF
jgi:site-specific DNA-methyltransferase (adenine-specific)